METKDPVYLINAGNDEGMSKIANDTCFPALGVLALGTWIKEKIPEVEVICRDGQVASEDDITSMFWENPPLLVGISTLSTSYQSALRIAHDASAFTSEIFLGNDHAAQTAPAILREHPFVEAVVCSEYGEESLEMLVRHALGEKIDVYNIPHLSLYYGYLGSKGATDFNYNERLHELSITRSRLNPSGKRRDALDIFPIVDRTLYPEDHWQTYLNNYKRIFGHLHEDEITGVTTMNRARGCSRKGKYACKHCDMGLDIAFSSPEKFWEEVRTAHEQVNANVFYEVCDSLSSFGNFVRQVAEKKPDDLGFKPYFFVYAQARDLVKNPELIDYFKKIGVFRANIGLESGCDTTLKHMKGKDDSVEKNYQALKMLKNSGIHVYGSFVLGTEAETPATLEETVGWIKKIITERLIQDIEIQPILPLPNNYYGKVLVREGLWKPASDWPKDTDSIAKLYVDNFSGVSYQEALDAAKEVRVFAKKHDLNCGSGVSQEEKYS